MKKEITFTAKIDVPEGYEAYYNEETKSVEIRKKNILPNSWEEFCENTPILDKEYIIDTVSNIVKAFNEQYMYNTSRVINRDKNILPNKETAEAFLALMQLIQLRDVYRQGWIPNYKSYDEIKYSIHTYDGKIEIDSFNLANSVISFQSEEIRDKFLNNFKDLIEQAKELL